MSPTRLFQIRPTNNLSRIREKKNTFVVFSSLSNIREVWIKSKYVDRKFVKPVTDACTPPGHRASRDNMHFRKWSVRKLRRRPRSCDKIDDASRGRALSTLSSVKEGHRSTSSDDSKHASIDSLNSIGKAKLTGRNSVSSDDSANVDLRNNSALYGRILNRSQHDLDDIANKHVTNIASHGEATSGEDIRLDSRDNDADETKNNRPTGCDTKDCEKDVTESKDSPRPEKHCKGKAESDVLTFGCDVPKPTIDGNLELVSSDQDSTAGEDEEFTDEEDIENLHPDMLLYKAAAAHNLPVMCAALAAGADKLWSNLNDKSRSALHQAIISVRILRIFYTLVHCRFTFVERIASDVSTRLFLLPCVQGSVMSCEYLLLNGARINCRDADGKTPLYLATELGIYM